ncbi:MAG: aldose 1-epimerase family protein [Armatimonadetes bacterium]|nr:aldose 1-epimerase family protein [Armatimonadota bacterium]
MPRLFGSDYTRAALMELVGHMDQVAGVDRLEYAEGPERNVGLLRFRTIPHSAHFEPPGLGWLRSFCGGLVTTCGLTNAGAPGSDPEHNTLYAGIGTEDTEVVKLGLHGRVNNTAARRVAADCHWDGDDYLLTASGKVREAIVFGENVELTRRILAVAGENALQIHDEVTNHGHDSVPHMMLYHINLGWPVVAPESVLYTGGAPVEPRDAAAAPGLDACHRFEAPQASYPEQVFYHSMTPDSSGFCHAAIVNRGLFEGFGVEISYSAESLPQLVQWKSMKRGTYVCGLEPSNSQVRGRDIERAAGRLRFLEPGETVTYDVEIAVVVGPVECEDVERRLAG